MPTPRTLTLLRPLLARPAQSLRASSTCGDRSPPPPCPPCEPTPPPPCRVSPQAPLSARRVVCCPPPQGSPPPCPPPPPTCAQSCDNYIRRKPASSPPSAPPRCTTARDSVAERLRCFQEHRRRQYEAAAAERAARPPPAAPAPRCPLPQPDSYALATDGRTYAVKADAPAPRCAPPPATHDPCAGPRSAHPPPQPVTLAPLGDCRPKERPRLDPCEHAPRTLLSIDRSVSRPPPADAAKCPEPKCAEPQNPKSQSTERSTASYKSITSRIMNSLKSGCGSTGQAGKACQIGKVSKVPRWCANPPTPAPAPPHCRPPTLVDRIGRCCPKSGTRPGKRRLHTAAVVAAAAASKAGGREATLAASEKLAAALKDRELLKEAGRGRCVRSPSCCPPPPPPPTNGGGIELGVPPGVDVVRVSVSMGKATISTPCPPRKPDTKTCPPRKPDTKTCPPPSTGSPRPAQSACSDSWLSIKKLQKKISSSCGRSEPAAPSKPPAPAAPGAGPCAAARPPAPRPGPSGVCSPQGRVKMADVLPHTIFVKS